MSVSHTIKDKAISRWQPLQRVPRIALSKLSPKRIFILLLVLACFFLFLGPPYFRSRDVTSELKEADDEVLLSLRKELKSILALRADLSSNKPAAIFVTAHVLYNASGITTLACDIAAAKKMNVLMMYMGRNSSETVPFFLRANQFDRSTCPIVWFDARHEYESIAKQEGAMEEVLADAVSALNPSVVVYVDDEEDWFLQALKTVVYLRSPRVCRIQLKRSALANLRWIASLNPAALAGIFLPSHWG